MAILGFALLLYVGFWTAYFVAHYEEIAEANAQDFPFEDEKVAMIQSFVLTLLFGPEILWKAWKAYRHD